MAGTYASSPTEKTARPARSYAGLLGRLATALALASLPLVAVSPLWTLDLVSTYDGAFHMYRALQLQACLLDGVLYPRWAPDFAQGFGYPIFNFYSPLANYVQVTLSWLGFGFPNATMAALALAFLVGGAGTFLFARDLLGPSKAVVAAVAYVYLPYHYTNAYMRSDVPEILALGLLPFVLWSFRRLVHRPTAGGVVLAASLYAAVVLTHNLTAFFFSPLLGVYVAALTVWSRGWRSLPHVALALAVGLGLSAFYWLPALGEKEYIQIERVVDPHKFDFRNHFLPLRDTLGLQPPSDLRQGARQPERWGGFPQLALAGLGVAALALRRTSREEAMHIVVFVGLAALLLYMMVPASIPTWESIPLAHFAQFPWRLLGPFGLFTALLAGSALGLVPQARLALGRWGGVSSTQIAIALASAALVLPIIGFNQFASPLDKSKVTTAPTIGGAMAFERNTNTLGTSTTWEYLPKWVEWIPFAPYEEAATCDNCLHPERLDRAALPPHLALTAEPLADRTNYIAYRFRSPEKVTVLFKVFYYPAWRAYVDGAEIDVSPFLQHGLGWITLTVPAGDHLVELRFEDTPLVRQANTVSAFSSAVALLLAAYAVTRRFRGTSSQAAQVPNSCGATSAFWPMVLAVAALAAAGPLYGDLAARLYYVESAPGVAANAQYRTAVDLAGTVRLIGYDLDRKQAKPGETIRMTLYWEPAAEITVNYCSHVEILTSDGTRRLVDSHGLCPQGAATKSWIPGRYYGDPVKLKIPQDAAPGEYLLTVGMFDPEKNRERLLVRGTQPERWSEVLLRFAILP